MRNRGFGNSAASVLSKIEELQTDRRLNSHLRYLGDYENYKQGGKTLEP